MSHLSTVELFKEDMKFSAGHFTIFSENSRENLHGHNYHVYAAVTTLIQDEGLSFDYRVYKKKLRAICNSLDSTTLIPTLCKHLHVSEKDDYLQVQFADETLLFCKRDVKLLPISNTTVEELSSWILSQILLDQDELERYRIQKIKVKVFSGPGQSGSATWRKSND